MAPTITVSRKLKNGTREEKVIPNPDPFPKCSKLGVHVKSPPVWKFADVLAYFKAHGLDFTDLDTAP